MTDVATLPEAAAKKPRKPRTHHTRTYEQLERAEYIRPGEIRLLYGIAESSLRNYFALDEAERLPRCKLRGVKGRRGLSLVHHATLRAWLKWQEWRGLNLDPKVETSAPFKDFREWLKTPEGQAAMKR